MCENVWNINHQIYLYLRLWTHSKSRQVCVLTIIIKSEEQHVLNQMYFPEWNAKHKYEWKTKQNSVILAISNNLSFVTYITKSSCYYTGNNTGYTVTNPNFSTWSVSCTQTGVRISLWLNTIQPAGRGATHHGPGFMHFKSRWEGICILVPVQKWC